jgi:hypothetical protein
MTGLRYSAFKVSCHLVLMVAFYISGTSGTLGSNFRRRRVENIQGSRLRVYPFCINRDGEANPISWARLDGISEPFQPFNDDLALVRTFVLDLQHYHRYHRKYHSNKISCHHGNKSGNVIGGILEYE